MGSHRQRFLHNLPALVTFLAGEAWVHSNHLMTSSCSLIFKDVKECAPTGVHDGFSEMMVLDHVADSQVFHCDTVMGICVPLSYLEMEITSLTCNLEMRLSCIPGSFASAMTIYLAAAQLALFASQGFLRGAIEAWILYRIALTIREKGLESYINTDIRMLTYAVMIFRSRFRLANDEGIPMSIGTVYQVHSLRSPFDKTVQLDLEKLP